MSQALRSTKCSYLRLLQAKIRACNTFVGAAVSLEKTHADVIQQFEKKCLVDGKLDGIPAYNRTTVQLQHGNQKISAVSKRYVAGNPCKSLDTKLAPVSVTEYRDDYPSAMWKCVHSHYDKPCIEHEDDTLVEDRDITGISRESLNGLSGQELNRLFQIAITTARYKAEAQADAIRRASARPSSDNWGIQLADLLSVQSNTINAIMKEMHKVFRIRDKINLSSSFNPTNCYTHNQQKTLKYNAPDGGKSKKGIMYFADASESTPNTMGDSGDSNKPNLDQLTAVRDFFVQVGPDIIGKRHGLYYYRQDVVLQNNYPDKPYQTVGLRDYVMQLSKLRWKVCMRYMNMSIGILGAPINEREGSFCLHWRFFGVPFKWLEMLKVWKWTPWTIQKTLEEKKEIFEGLATFSIDGDGRIYKVRIDKVVVDPYGAEEETPSLVEKLALGGNPA